MINNMYIYYVCGDTFYIHIFFKFNQKTKNKPRRKSSNFYEKEDEKKHLLLF